LQAFQKIPVIFEENLTVGVNMIDEILATAIEHNNKHDKVDTAWLASQKILKAIQGDCGGDFNDPLVWIEALHYVESVLLDYLAEEVERQEQAGVLP
jgi:hypothetical protein